MAIYKEERLLDVSKQFQIYGEIQHAEPCKIGHINETYTATYNQGGVAVRYIHQRINTSVFRKPMEVMDNVTRVTQHLRRKLVANSESDITRKALVIIPTHEGKSYYCNGDGECWRTFVFIENAQTYEAVQSPEQAYEAGFAFGKFQCLLADLPGKRLAETIPDFHNTRKRFLALQAAIKADSRNRAQEAQKEIDFALQLEPIVDVLLNALKKGEIPERITHNDTKFNNVMLDNATGRALAVVDLDTVMPGLVHYDFGDIVRTTTSPTPEDELDLTQVRMQMPMFKALARGYLEAASPFLKKKERSFIAFAGKLITYTIGIRFLTDYLQGDTYFRVHRPHHNLDRCRTQFKLVESIIKQEEAMQKYVDSL